MKRPAEDVPDYSVRVSNRARSPRLRVSAEEGLVVVLPAGYPPSSVPEILRRHRLWIERAFAKTAERRTHVESASSCDVPDRVELPGIGVTWSVERRSSASTVVRARRGNGEIVLTGAVGDRDACLAAIRSAVSRAARERLPLMLGGIETETGWPATKVTVRRQKTRWGSCTAKGSINLNEALAFLPPHLVRHVLVHELAHTQRLDHSPRFWALVQQHDAAWREHRRELRDAWRHVPPWALQITGSGPQDGGEDGIE